MDTTKGEYQMEIAFAIPIWLLWVLGILGGICALGLIVLGIVLLSFVFNWHYY